MQLASGLCDSAHDDLVRTGGEYGDFAWKVGGEEDVVRYDAQLRVIEPGDLLSVVGGGCRDDQAETKGQE